MFVGTFYEEELQKVNQEELRIEMVIKRKGDKSHIKLKCCDNLLNSWIDKKKTLCKTSQYFPKPRDCWITFV